MMEVLYWLETDTHTIFTHQHLLNTATPEDIVKAFGQGRMVKIKFEVDTQPSLDLESEKKTLLIPSPFAGKCMLFYVETGQKYKI